MKKTKKITVLSGPGKAKKWAFKHIEFWIIVRAYDFFGPEIWFWRKFEWETFYKNIR